MRKRSRPISERSVPKVLGMVGKEALEEVMRRNGWLGMRYTRRVGFVEDGEAKFPFLVEVAVFNRKSDGEGLQVYQCVNFMASRRNLF
jgi:hypothetical protein